MEADDGSLGIRNWGFYDTVKGSLGLQLMSSMPPDRDTKPLLPRGVYWNRGITKTELLKKGISNNIFGFLVL
jgi:hypothetical protein